MKRFRLATLAIVLASPLCGCRTGGLGNLSPPAGPVADRPSVTAADWISAYNHQAELVQSLEAKPTIQANIEGRSYPLKGHLALERPRSFKLDVYHLTSSVADIGSNDDEFWFWVAPKGQKAEKAVFYCKYEDTKRSALPPTFQPDWIMEAMGLRIIPEAEIADFRIKRGKEPDTLELTHVPDPAQGGSEGFTRVTTFIESTRRIKQHVIYAADQTTLLGRAVVVDYREFKVKPEDGGPDEIVAIPARVKLEWMKEQLVLDITLGSETRMNLTFTPKQRAARFVEPELRGYARVNLADRPELAKDPTTIRETRPAPRSRIQLDEPAPVDQGDSRQPPREPVVLAADVPDLPDPDDQLVAPPLPTAPEPDFLKPENAYGRNAGPAGYER